MLVVQCTRTGTNNRGTELRSAQKVDTKSFLITISKMRVQSRVGKLRKRICSSSNIFIRTVLDRPHLQCLYHARKLQYSEL